MLRTEVTILREQMRKAARDQPGHSEQSDAASNFNGDKQPAGAHCLLIDRESRGI